MDLTVALDARYALTPDGRVWSQAGMAQRFWERYLAVFSQVHIVARAVRVERVPAGWLPVNGEAIQFHPVPNYHGPWQYLMRYREVQTAIRSAVPSHGAVILRVGSQIANCLEAYLRRRKHPYALEILGDPYEVFAAGVVDHPLRRIFRWYFTRKLQKQCLRASGVAYVTRDVLQKRYPANLMSAVSDVDLPEDAVLGAGCTHYSSIELDPSGIVQGVRRARRAGGYQIVTVGSLAQLYKGTDVFITALAQCVRGGLDVSAVVVGDGKYRRRLEELAAKLGMSSRVRFTGQVTAGDPVRRILDSSDLFVLPSRTEGLPRALIEAMARALPCIGSAVGGIPELLEPGEMVPAGDAMALAAKIRELLSDPDRMDRLSVRNRAVSLDYRDSVLAERRRAFYQYVRDYTKAWEMKRPKGR